MSFKVVRKNGVVVCFGPNIPEYAPVVKSGEIMTVEQSQPVFTPTITSVSRRQARLAMSQAGVLDAVEVWVSNQPKSTQIWYQDAASFEINNPIVIQAATDLGWNNLQDLFNLAATL